MVLLVMGVSGAGKTTVGVLLARRLGWRFVEADLLHPTSNIEKMRGGIPLTDDDRRPWLEALRDELHRSTERGEDVVVACSALKRSYRRFLREGLEEMAVVFLEAPPEVVARRLEGRRGHFMNPELLGSQFEALEPPEGLLAIDASGTPDEIVSTILEKLDLHVSSRGE